MKRHYVIIRISLMTFAVGLASVFMINGSLQHEEKLELPQTDSGEILVVFPRYSSQIPFGGGGGGGPGHASQPRRIAK